MERKRTHIEVDGEQVFTADFVFQQMQAQSARQYRSTSIAVTALVVSLAAICAVIVQAIL